MHPTSNKINSILHTTDNKMNKKNTNEFLWRKKINKNNIKKQVHKFEIFKRPNKKKIVEQDHGQTKTENCIIKKYPKRDQVNIKKWTIIIISQDCNTQKFNDLWLFSLVSLV